MSKAKFDGNNLLIDAVDFKRLSKTLHELLNERVKLNKPIELNEIHEMLSIGIGYADYHNLHKEAKGNTQLGYEPFPDPFESIKEQYESSLDKNAAWLKEACPRKLLERRSLTWCESALNLTSFDYQMWRTHPVAPHVTLIIGKDSELVAKAISNVHNGHSKLIDVNDDKALNNLLDNVLSSIEEVNLFRASSLDRTGMIIPRNPNKISPGQYHCIKGFDKVVIDQDVINKLVEISDLDYGLDLAVSIKRSDLVKFTKPDLSQPHFHHLTILDLDKIGTGENGQYIQSLYDIWVDETTRQGASSMKMGV
ncbi:hypothetical protein ACNZA9_003540 [Cronobacter sakazakii]